MDHEKDELLKNVIKKGQAVSKLNIFYEDRLIKSEILYSSINTEKKIFL